MKILAVSSFLPYPLFSGGHVRLFNLIKGLSKRHSITLVCEKRDYQTKQDVEELKKLCLKVITVDRRKQWSLNNIIKAGFSSYPFLMVGHTSDLMKKQIESLLEKETFDLIHLETFYIAQNLPQTQLPIVLAEHNIEYLVYRRYLKKVKLVKPLLMLDVWKMKIWEEKFWKMATKLVAVSEEEKRLMRREDAEVVANGVDVAKFPVLPVGRQIPKRERRVLFIGDFRWVQNRDAAEWIISEIWPEISLKFKVPASRDKQSSKLKLWIVGREIPGPVKNMVRDKDIILDENAPGNTFEIYKEADVLLAPIRVGGGTSFKILEAMASGVPVVTTRLGIEGIDAGEGKEVLIAETKEEFCDKLTGLLKDSKLYNSIRINARKLIEEKYNWEKIVEKLEDVYESAINK